jgi:hypothetical protein
MFVVEQRVTVSDPFVPMPESFGGIHSIDPATIDVAKLSSACFSFNTSASVSAFIDLQETLAPICNSPASIHQPERIKRPAVHRQRDQKPNRPTGAKLRHPRKRIASGS